MFGIPSSPKLILILLVVGVVWWLIRRSSGRSQANPGDSTGSARPNARSGTAESRPVEDMLPCPKCGAYVAKNASHDCVKANTGR
jgi:hypothetical protein